jgi:hypothetical protein
LRSARGGWAGAAVLCALAATGGCSQPAPKPSNAAAQVTCAEGDQACVRAQFRAREAEMERQILAQHEAETNAAAALANQALSNAAPAGAEAATLPSGEYDCSDGKQAMGKVEIKGAAFAYRPLGAFSAAFAPYQIDAAGHIQWGAALAGINDTPPEMIAQSTVEPWGFTVAFQASPTSPVQTMICQAPLKRTPLSPGAPGRSPPGR